MTSKYSPAVFEALATLPYYPYLVTHDFKHVYGNRQASLELAEAELGRLAGATSMFDVAAYMIEHSREIDERGPRRLQYHVYRYWPGQRDCLSCQRSFTRERWDVLARDMRHFVLIVLALLLVVCIFLVGYVIGAASYDDSNSSVGVQLERRDRPVGTTVETTVGCRHRDAVALVVAVRHAANDRTRKEDA